MMNYASLSHRGSRGRTILSDEAASLTEARTFAWKRIIEAHTGRSISPWDVPGPAELKRLFPDSVFTVERYAQAYARCRGDSERAEVVERILAPHAAAVATRSLASIGRSGNSDIANRRARQARLAPRWGSRKAYSGG